LNPESIANYKQFFGNQNTKILNLESFVNVVSKSNSVIYHQFS